MGDLPLEHVRCSNCGAEGGEVVARGRDHEYPHTSDATFTFVRCACGLVYLDPRPTVAALDRIYPKDYYAYQLAERRRSAKGGDSVLARYMERQATRRMKPYAAHALARRQGDGPMKVLDVGCGDGATLDLFVRAFGDVPVETHGVEMSHEAAALASARGHRVVAARIEDANLPRGHFDLAYSFHVIEHVTDPRSFLAKIREALSPRGTFVLETPNVDTVDFRLFGRGAWGAYHFPRHFTLYDERTLARITSETGFAIDRVEYVPSAIHWVWTMHAALHERAPALADRLFPPVDVFLDGSLWNAGLLSAFTTLDMAVRAFTRHTSVMRVTLHPA